MKILTLFLCAAVPLMASAVTCPDGWKPFRSLCYLLMSTPKTWSQAESYCLSQGGHLTSIHSESEYTFLQSLTTVYSWVGGYNGGKDGVFFWSDGTEFRYQNWSQGEPTGARQECIAINYLATLWDDGNCKSEVPFICSRKPPAITCPDDWKQFQSLCYGFMSTPKTWSQAESYCLGHGGHLTSIHSESEYTFLQSLTTVYSWVGGYNGGQDGVWFWSDGTEFRYQNWTQGEPTGGQHCIAINYLQLWDDGDCGGEQPFICSHSL